MKLTYRSVLATAVSFLFVPASLFAASLAFDSASDPAYGGVWTNGSNGGTGWNGGWAMFIGTTLSNTPTAQFIGSSTNNDINGDTNGDGDIDTSGKSWGLLGNGQDVFAERLLTGALNVGQKIVISMDNGVVPTNDPNAEVGVLLQNDLNETRLQFKMGSTTNIYDLEHIGPATGITNTDQGLMIEVEVVTIDTAKVSVTTLGDGVTHVFSNILMNAGVTSGHHQINYVVLENKSTGGGVTNQSFFNSMYVLPDTNDSTFFADQSLGMAASANPAIVNSNLTYTITVTNKGPSVATSMTVTDVPPSGVTFVSATSAQGTCTTDAFGRVICTVGSLASNGVASIALVVTPLASGVITNIASASALNVDPNPGDNVLTNIASVVTAMQLSVTPASFEFGTIATGTTQQTSFVVTNLGGATLTGTATVSTATFAVVSGSPFSIAGFGTTNVGVSFTPSSTGSFTDNVVFASDGGVSTNTVTGTGAVVPVASFTGAPRAGLVPLLVTFTNSSTGTITNRFWNFGDSGTTNTSNPTVAHTYNSTGTDTVTLIVSGPLGVSTNTQLGYITVTNIPPVQTVTPASHDFGLLAVGQSSTQTFSVINGGVDALIGTATVSGVQFVLVGGSPYNVSGGQTGSVTVSFDPNSAGSFTGSVAFASNGGDSTNTVTGSAAIAPVADFTASATNGFAPLSVTFTDTSTGTITNHSWTFGDGGTSTASSPSHTYTNAGVFSVSLTVDGPLGASTTNRVNLIAVTNAPPGASFTASPTNGAAPLTVTFTDTSTGTITNHSWTFGDGGTSTASSPSHTYTNAGTFSVALTVLGPDGSSTTNRANLITATNAPPKASFTASPASGAAPLTVTFTDTSTGTITNHSWTFGDGGTSTASSPGHTYTNAGTFSVSLTVAGPLGSSTTNRANLITVTNNVVVLVHIVRPANGMLYPATFTNQTITIVATASSTNSISKIEFFDGTNKLGQATSSPATNVLNHPVPGVHTLTARATDSENLVNTSTAVVITIGAKNSPLGDWEVTISGADKGVEFVTLDDDASASGYDIRLKKFGLNDVTGTWALDAKGKLSGPFIEQLGSATNWTGTLTGSAKSLKSLSVSVTTTSVGVFHWKGVPATEFPNLSGTWSGVVTVVKAKAATPVSYAIRTNANDSAVFDVTTSINTNTVIGQLIATSRNVVYGYVAVGGTNITMSGKFKDQSAKALPDTMTFKGADTNATADKVSIQLSR